MLRAMSLAKTSGTERLLAKFGSPCTKTSTIQVILPCNSFKNLPDFATTHHQPETITFSNFKRFHYFWKSYQLEHILVCYDSTSKLTINYSYSSTASISHFVIQILMNNISFNGALKLLLCSFKHFYRLWLKDEDLKPAEP